MIMLVRYRKTLFKHKTELLNSRINAQEESMKLISDELHDNVGQLLSLSRMHAKTIASQTSSETVQNASGNLYSLLTQAINEVRFVSHSLNGERMEQLG